MDFGFHPGQDRLPREAALLKNCIITNREGSAAFYKDVPILGICYGLQLIAKIFGGKIKSSKKRREFGRAYLFKKKSSPLIKNFLNKKNTVWMSHEDAVIKLPKNFKSIAYTKNSKLTIIENSKRKIYGVQFHPEVTHTENGKQIFKNFIFSICKIKKIGV